MRGYLIKLRGKQESRPPRAAVRTAAFSAVGAFCGIALIAWLCDVTARPLMAASFGASALLLFAFPESPLSQPRSLIGGHVLSALIGLGVLALCGSCWWSIALACSLAILVMKLTCTVHPPAASNPLIVLLTQAKWGFLFTPVLAGAVMLTLAGVLYNNLHRDRHYPRYWL